MKDKVKKILLVDDEREIVEFLEDFFKRMEFQIDTAYSGAEAIEKAKAFVPDLVLLDMHIGKPDGLEVLREILKNCPKTKVMMLTAESSRTGMEKALSLGACHYLVKPLRLDELEEEVRRSLQS